jgi:large subunit ribosomal protein L4
MLEPLKLKVVNRQGEEVGTVEVDPAEFGGKINKQLLHDVVIMHLANQRAGTHSTLRRGEVAGSTKKLFRQKGTGNARVGTRRTNKRKGGGTAKGPKPRDYEYHMPKKAVRAATRMAILLKALKLKDTTCLIGLPGLDPLIYRAARNIPGLEVFPTKEFNAYTVLKQKRLLLTKAALEQLRQAGKEKTAAATEAK